MSGQSHLMKGEQTSGEKPDQSRPQTPSRAEVWRMFDRIAHRYDLLNHLLSFNRDKAWRRKMTTLLPKRCKLVLLDLATGTADQLLAIFNSGQIARGVGLDPAEQMLAIGRQKIEERGLGDKLTLQTGSAEQLPFADRSFDIVTMSFGIRNVTDVSLALKEIHRVLKPEGRALILEFSLPKNGLLRRTFLLYFRHILPRLGELISGDATAYRYLNQTVETFPYGEDFSALMTKAGFVDARRTPLTFGVATIYQGDKR